MAKPIYNLARGEAELTDQLRPPFSFRDVTARVFPLSADMGRLAEYCDAYLNFVPPEVAQFRPAVPYVYLVVAYYGQMRSTKLHGGWIAQRELAFLLPLQWYRAEGGRMVFVDWAWTCPYIFVDDDISLMTGRQVYGWAKLPASITEPNPPGHAASENSLWGSRPHRDSRLLTMRIAGLPLGIKDGHTDDKLLLTIDHESGPTFSLLPPALVNPLKPLRDVLQTAQRAVSTMRDWLDVLPGFASLGYRIIPDLQAINLITLKEIRDTTNPEEICYQALVNSHLKINKYLEGGLLGDVNPLRGDLTSGFRINLYRSLGNADPIMNTLGLDAEDHQGNGYSAVTLKPFSPLWAQVELGYEKAHTLCWRAKDSGWYRGSTSDPLTRP